MKMWKNKIGNFYCIASTTYTNIFISLYLISVNINFKMLIKIIQDMISMACENIDNLIIY